MEPAGTREIIEVHSGGAYMQAAYHCLQIALLFFFVGSLHGDSKSRHLSKTEPAGYDYKSAYYYYVPLSCTLAVHCNC